MMQTSKEESSLLFTMDTFPQTPQIKDKVSLPWGVAIHPLNPRLAVYRSEISQNDIPRCEKCYGYMNLYCMFDSKTWKCPLCQYRNRINKSMFNGRYASSIERSRCAECLYPNIELEMPISQLNKGKRMNLDARMILVIIMDCTGYRSFHEFMKALSLRVVQNYHEEGYLMLFVSGDRLGIFNIQKDVTKVLYTYLYSTSTTIPLINIMCFEESSCSLSLYRSQALSAITPIKQLKGEFCFAETMRLVADYLQVISKEGSIIGGKCICFINHNSDDTSINSYSDNVSCPTNELDASNRLRVNSSIYSRITEQLQAIGMSIDIINNITHDEINTISNRIDVVLLQQLCNACNGSLICVDLNDERSVELCRKRVLMNGGGEYGYDCIFRIRSSGGIVIRGINSTEERDNSVGIRGLQFVSNNSDINYINSMSNTTIIPFDFKYSQPSGSTITADDFPLIQLVVEYTTLSKKEDGEKLVYSVVRRMRICTVEYHVSSKIMEIYASANPSVIMYILLRKSLCSLLKRSFSDCRLLLKEWLLSFVSHYLYATQQCNHILDYTFKVIPKLKILPKYIYSAIRGVYLNPTGEYTFYRTLQEQNLILQLSPLLLSRYLYPQLSAYANEDKLDIPRLNLSWKTVVAVDCPIYTYLSHDSIIVFYMKERNGGPTVNSLLSSSIKRIENDSALLYPLLISYWTNTDNGNAFRSYMIDDNDDATKNYSSFESSIIDKAVESIMQR